VPLLRLKAVPASQLGPDLLVLQESAVSGKGDTPRPKSVSEEQFAENWDAVFNKQEQSGQASRQPIENKD
jgi:hypothetical protein